MPDCKIVTTERRPTAVVRVKARLSELREAQQTSRARLTEVLPTLGVAPLGHTCTLWRPPVDGVLDMEAGALVSGPFAAVDDVVPSELPAGRAAYFLLRGSFEGLPDAWKTLLDWCAARKARARRRQLGDLQPARKPRARPAGDGALRAAGLVGRFDSRRQPPNS